MKVELESLNRGGSAVVQAGRVLTATDLCLCLLPIVFFLSIVSLV